MDHRDCLLCNSLLRDAIPPLGRTHVIFFPLLISHCEIQAELATFYTQPPPSLLSYYYTNVILALIIYKPYKYTTYIWMVRSCHHIPWSWLSLGSGSYMLEYEDYSLLIFLLESDACHQDFLERKAWWQKCMWQHAATLFVIFIYQGLTKATSKKYLGPANNVVWMGFWPLKTLFFFVHAPVKFVPGTPPPQCKMFGTVRGTTVTVYMHTGLASAMSCL